MKNILYSFVVMAAAATLLGCGKDKHLTLEDVSVWPSSDFVTKLHFVSRLTDAATGSTEADFAPVTGYFSSTVGADNVWLGIIDRADVTYNAASQQNSALKSALDLKFWTYLAFNRIRNGSTFEGSALFLRAPVTGSTAYALGNDCFVAGPVLKMQGKKNDGTSISFDIYFRTARFETQANVDAFGGDNGILFQMKRERMNFLMVGTVKNTLVDPLRTAIDSHDRSFKFSIVEGTENRDYAIFVLAEEHFWRYVGATSTSLGGGLDAYEISLNW
ncbi:MAG: hypothetical protein LBH06_02785 [Rikenellaceae bacterium]|jgi:hypothetical protein|nr:hypothetical protein [Rikenellaceae bacterium]